MGKSRFKDWLSWFFIVFNFSAGIASIWSLVNTYKSKTYISVIIIILILGFLVFLVDVIRKIATPINEKAASIADNFHHLAHSYKELYLDLLQEYEDIDDAKAFGNDRLVNLQSLVVKYRELLSSAFRFDVNVSIKLFRTDAIDTLYTYCRAGLSPKQSIQREHREKIVISKCTSFSRIMDGNVKFFLGGNLKDAHKKGNYDSYRSRFAYSSACVVPIRLMTKNSESDELQYDTVGFLCIDSKRKNIFDGIIGTMVVETARAFSDLLYVFISETQAYYESMNSNEQRDQATVM